MQWSEGGVALHLVDQLWSDALVFGDCRAAADHAVPDRCWKWKRRLLEGLCYQCKSGVEVRDRGRFIDELLAFFAVEIGLDGELAEILLRIGADAVNGAL